MEENEVIKEKTNDNYFGGIIGAVLGAVVGAIPWTLLYLFANINSALLTILVGLGAIKGYKLFKGKITKKTKTIIAIVSLIILLGVDLIGLPVIYTYLYSVDLKAFYTEMKTEIIHDLIFTLLFGVFGICYAITRINVILEKEKIKNENKELSEKEVEEKAERNASLTGKRKADLDVLRKVFTNLNALNKKTAVDKQIIIEELNKENVEDSELLFNSYKASNVIRKKKGKFYYDVNSDVVMKKGYWLWFIIVIIVAVANSINNNIEDTTTDYDNTVNSVISEQGDQIYDFNGKNITITVPEEFTITEENGIYFIEKEDSYAVVYLYDKSELADGLTLEDCITSVEDYIYGIYEAEEKIFMEAYSNLNKKAYKLSFDSVEGIYKVKISSYLTETSNYIIEVHLISEANKAVENEPKYENMINSLVEKNSVEE